MRIGERLSVAGNEADARAVPKICQVFQASEYQLAGYADDMRDGRIERSRKV